jgi:hypothetical protein
MKTVMMIACWALAAAPVSAVAGEVRSTGNSHVSPMMNTVTSTTKDGKVCKRVLRTGSRLGDNQICKTKADWDVITQDARRATEKKQIFYTTQGGDVPGH